MHEKTIAARFYRLADGREMWLANMRDDTGSKQSPGGIVYMDYAATTPADPQVVAAMVRYLGPDGIFGNPASRSHRFGQEAAEAVERAREQVADLIHASPYEIVWTSGATESINLALKGVAYACAERGRHIVTSSLEHKAVLDTCAQLVREGFEITYVQPDQYAVVSPERVAHAMRDDTILVSLMHVNNEVGAVTDIGAVGTLTRARGVLFHVDAVQSAARLPLDMNALKVDLVSLSAHKMYGPKGIGALYARSRSRIQIKPQMHGGDQERGLRSGTLAAHQIVGMGEAARLVGKRRQRDSEATTKFQDRLTSGLGKIRDSFINGNQWHCIPGIINIGFGSVDSESLMMALKDVAISSGSACTSARIESSHVLRAMGLPEEAARCSVRFSLGRFTTESEIDFAVTRVRQSVSMLRQLSLSRNTRYRSEDSKKVRKRQVVA